MQHRLLPARVYGPRQGFRAIDGSSKVEKAGSRPPRAGIAGAPTFCRSSVAPIPMLLPNGVFRSSSWSVLHQAWSSNGRSIRWGTARTSCRSSDSKGLASQAVISSGVLGGGLALTAACFTGAAALVGIFAVGLMRAAFEFALDFARNERRGGIHPIIEHQAVGYALADAKMAIEATRYLCWRACRAVDLQSPGAEELAIEAKVFGSETAVRVLTDLMRVVGIESYDHALPLGRLLQDALALPVFGGGNIGVRRRRLHAILQRPEYDPLAASSEVEV